MSDFLEVLKDRRSIRKYSEETLSDELLTQVLEAVQCTQSWHNTQCWEVVIVDDPKVREDIQKAVPSKNPSYNAIVEAGVLVAMCGKKESSGFFDGKAGSQLGDWMMHDVGLATQNLCNAAHAMGLGTVVLGWFDHAKIKEIIGLPEEFELISLIPLGHPGHAGRSPRRKELGDFVHKNKFGDKLF